MDNAIPGGKGYMLDNNIIFKDSQSAILMGKMVNTHAVKIQGTLTCAILLSLTG